MQIAKNKVAEEVHQPACSQSYSSHAGYRFCDPCCIEVVPACNFKPDYCQN
jgi:hypothetical protein